jgi:hypothetical protein
MQTLEQIEREVRQLPLREQELLFAHLSNLLKRSEATDAGTREDDLSRFFAEWDGSHSVTVGEKPTRARTYADNSRLR